MEASTTALFLSLVLVACMLEGFHCRNISILFLSSSGSEFDSTGARRAVHMAVEHVNDNHLLSNHTLQIIGQGDHNTMCNRWSVLDSYYENLCEDSNLVAVIGAGCSIATETVAGISHYNSITTVSHSSPSEVLDDREQFPYFFRTIPSDKDIMLGISEFIDHFNWRRVVVISQDEEQFKVAAELLTNNLNTSVVKNILLSFSYPGNTMVELFPPDMRIFVINADPATSTYILCEAIRNGLTRYQYVWITQLQEWHVHQWRNNTPQMLHDNLNCTVEELEEFLLNQSVITFSHYPANVNTSLPSVAGITPGKFMTLYSAMDEEEEDWPAIIEESVYFAYDAVLAIALGLEAAVQPLAEDCGTHLEDLDLHPKANVCAGRTIRDSISSVQFNGVSGYILFQNGSRVTHNLRVLQFQQSFSGITVQQEIATITDLNTGENVSLNFLESVSSLWPGGIPSDGTPVVVENYPPLWLVAISYTFSAAVIFGAVVSMVFTSIFRKRKLVRLTSPNLNQVIALGVIMFNSSVFLFSYPPVSNGALEVFCALRVWTVVIGISLCFMTINTKMFRIYYIFHNPTPSKKNKVIKDWHLFALVVLFVLIDILVLLPVSALNSARLQAEKVEDVEHTSSVNENGTTVNFVVTLCESSGRKYWLTFLFGYKAIIQGIGLFLALRIRNIKIKVLNDSKEIAATIYLSSAILAVVVVVSFALGNRLTVYTASYSLGIPLSTSVVLIVVFFTKMIRLYKDPRGENIFTHETPQSDILSGGIKLNTKDDKVHVLEKQVRDLQRQLLKYETAQTASRNGHSNSSSSSTETENVHHISSDGDSGFIIENTRNISQEENGNGVRDKVKASQNETNSSVHALENMEGKSGSSNDSVLTSAVKDGEIEMNDTTLTDISDVHVNVSSHDELTDEHSERNSYIIDTVI